MSRGLPPRTGTIWPVAPGRLPRLRPRARRRGGYLDDSFASADDLEAVHGVLATSGVEHEVRQPVRGRDAADELTRVAEETGAEPLVIGMRRRSPVGKLLLGSEAQRILLDAACPVLAVKTDTTGG